MKQLSGTNLKRTLALLLTIGMILSLMVLPASAVTGDTYADRSKVVEGDGITISDYVLELNSVQDLTATLTVPTSSVDGDAQAWASSLVWSLTRTEDMFVQDPEIYPHVYTGDKLENWQIWDSANEKYGEGIENSPWFYYLDSTGAKKATTAEAVSVETSGSNTVVTLKFSTNPFFGKVGFTDYGGPGIRNVFNSFNGPYLLTASAGDKVVGSCELEVQVYRSYHRYNEVLNELEALKKAAEARTGRYVEILEYGKSEGGFPMYAAVVSDSKESVDAFRKINETVTTNPQGVIDQIKSGSLKDYRIPFMINNQHSDEYPNMDAELNLLWELISEDTLTYRTLTGLKDGTDVPKYWSDQLDQFEINGCGAPHLDVKADGTQSDNDGEQGADEIYAISEDISYKVDDLLDNLIMIVSLAENPDGRTYGSRRNYNGIDHNRDSTFQTQSETRAIAQLINEWNPIAFVELHGYMTDFLIEPCTPPHEPNLEYDILIPHFFEGAEAYGNSALGTIAGEGYDYKFSQYYVPLRDNFDREAGSWDAWDDLSTNYTPSYAMLNCNAAGYTIETPRANEASTRLFECGFYGIWQYYMEHKEEIYLRQMEFFLRGLNNTDASENIAPWYVDFHDKQIPVTDMRPVFDENGKFFCEYWVIPVDGASQRNVGAAYDMAEFLVRNHIQVSKLTADTTVGGTTYKAGSFVVDMHQAKRNYANCVLYSGVDASYSGFVSLYSDAVTNYPEQWGFDAIPVAVEGAFSGKLEAVDAVTRASSFTGESGKYVIISNESVHSANAVNALLGAGKTVGMVVSGDYKGDFVVNYADYQTVKDDFTLSAVGVSAMPDARRLLREPTIYLVGLLDEFQDAKISTGYYANWFSEGYGSTRYDIMHNSETANVTRLALTEQMNFKTTDDPAKADIIVGNVAPTANPKNTDAILSAVKAGTPYLAMGWGPMNYIKENLLPNVGFEPNRPDGDMLHYITYPTDSLLTANHVADGDDIIYAVDGVYFDGAILDNPNTTILIRCLEGDTTDYMIAGCAPNAAQMSGKVEAIAYSDGKLDLTLFGNSLTNRAFQRDDYTYASNTIYTKVMLSDVPMDHWGVEGIDFVMEKGLMNGTSATTFAPAVETSKAMLVTILARNAGVDTNGGATWYEKGINWAVTNDIVDAENAEGPVTRERLADMLYRARKLTGSADAKGDLSTYADAGTVSDWAAEAMAWAVGEGIITGKDGNRLDPAGTVTRAEASLMLMRYLSK